MTVSAELTGHRRLYINGHVFEKNKPVPVDAALAEVLRKNGSFSLTDLGNDGPKAEVVKQKKERKRITKPDEPTAPVVIQKVEKKTENETKDETTSGDDSGSGTDDPSTDGAVGMSGA